MSRSRTRARTGPAIWRCPRQARQVKTGNPGYRRLGLGTALLLHGMRLARQAGATHMMAACLGAPGDPRARGLYYRVGFRRLSRDLPLIKPAA